MKKMFILLLATNAFASLLEAQVQLLPPDFTLFGKTSRDYSAEYHQFSLSLSTNFNLSLEPQSGPLDDARVYFLNRPISIFQVPGVQRYFVPDDVYLFFPIIYYTWDNVDTTPLLSIEQLRANVGGYVDKITAVQAVFDGVPVENLLAYRTQSPVFSAYLATSDNSESLAAGHPVLGLIDPIVADGYFVMLAPLTVGWHDFRVSYTIGGPNGFPRERHFQIYSLSLAQRLSQQILQLSGLVTNASLPTRDAQALIGSLNAALGAVSSNDLTSAISQLTLFQTNVLARVLPQNPALAEQLLQGAQHAMDQARQALIRAAVLHNEAIVDEKTIGEWTVEWWNWVYAQPTNQSPLIDNDGSHAAAGQPAGSVFLLGNTARPGQVTRQITVEEGKHLFFPVRYVSLDNVDFSVPLPPEQLRDSAAGVVALMANLHVVIDGTDIDVMAHRVTSPVFSYVFGTPDNLESFISGHPVTGLVDPIVSDGYWIMLQPLPVGTHTINFGGDIGPPFNSSKDVTDIITVVPIRLADQVEQLIALLDASNLPAKRKRALIEELREAAKDFSRNHLRPAIEELREFQKKVAREVGKIDEALATRLINAAQQIIDRATPQLKPPRHEGPNHEENQEDRGRNSPL